MIVTLESLITDSLNDLVVINEDSNYDFELVELNMECNDIVGDINTLACAATVVTESSGSNNGIFKKAMERIKDFFKAIGRFFHKIFERIRQIFTSQKIRVYDELIKHIQSLPDDFKAVVQENDFINKLQQWNVTGKDVKEFANDTNEIITIIASQSHRIMDPDQLDNWENIMNELNDSVEKYNESIKNNNVQKIIDIFSVNQYENDGNPTSSEHDKTWLLERSKWASDICKSYVDVEKSIKKTYDNFIVIEKELTNYRDTTHRHLVTCNKVIGWINFIQSRTSRAMLVLMSTNTYTLKLLNSTGYSGKYKFASN